MKKTKLMRVPTDFYDDIKEISSRRNMKMTELLSDVKNIIKTNDRYDRIFRLKW